MSEYIKLIKLDDAISVCREKQIIEGDAVTGIRYPTPDEIINDLSDLPTIEIVECGECRWRDDCSQTVANFDGTVDTIIRWCSDGERIEE